MTTYPVGTPESVSLESTHVEALVGFRNASNVQAQAVGFAFQLLDSSHHPIKTFTGLVEGAYAPDATLTPLDADISSVACSVIYAKFSDGTIWRPTRK